MSHGVGMVDKVGIACLCDADFSFDRGGWVAFNAHLAATVRQQVADLRWPADHGDTYADGFGDCRWAVYELLK